MKPFLIALQFLTRIPLPFTVVAERRAMGRSLLYYPLVGLVLGSVLAGLRFLLSDTPPMLCAALLLAAWVLLTGALHLDGLADSADAWIGGLGNRRRTLAIMQDSCCGPAAVVAISIVLLIKFTALHELESGDWLILVLVPLLARTTTLLLFLTTPYVRPRGIGAALAATLPRQAAGTVVAITSIVVIYLAGANGWWLLVVIAAAFLLLRHTMMRRLGGTTGDTAGALIELCETVGLVTGVLVTR